MAATFNLVIDQGSSFSTALTIENDDGSAYNLTGDTGYAQMRKAYSSSTIAATFTVTIPTPANGQVIISLTDEETVVIKPGRYVWDLLLEKSGGARNRATEGIVSVKPHVTQV